LIFNVSFLIGKTDIGMTFLQKDFLLISAH